MSDTLQVTEKISSSNDEKKNETQNETQNEQKSNNVDQIKHLLGQINPSDVQKVEDLINQLVSSKKLSNEDKKSEDTLQVTEKISSNDEKKNETKNETKNDQKSEDTLQVSEKISSNDEKKNESKNETKNDQKSEDKKSEDKKSEDKKSEDKKAESQSVDQKTAKKDQSQAQAQAQAQAQKSDSNAQIVSNIETIIVTSNKNMKVRPTSLSRERPDENASTVSVQGPFSFELKFGTLVNIDKFGENAIKIGKVKSIPIEFDGIIQLPKGTKYYDLKGTGLPSRIEEPAEVALQQKLNISLPGNIPITYNGLELMVVEPIEIII